MKKSIVFAAFLVSLSAYSQDSLITYTDVVQVAGVMKDPLYVKARSWVTETMNNEKDEVTVSDKDMGEISGKGTCRLKVKYKLAVGSETKMMDCNYIFHIWVKDNRYKYEFSNIEVRQAVGMTRLGKNVVLSTADNSPKKVGGISGQKLADSVWVGMKESAEEYFEKLSDSLERTMKTKSDKSNF